jgi:hypothetical protein
MKLLKPLREYSLFGHKRNEDICQELNVINITDITAKVRNVLCNHTFRIYPHISHTAI